MCYLLIIKALLTPATLQLFSENEVHIPMSGLTLSRILIASTMLFKRKKTSIDSTILGLEIRELKNIHIIMQTWKCRSVAGVRELQR